VEAALYDIRVIDLSRHISGPYCSSLLADMGAEVIRIELPGGDADRRFGYTAPSGDSFAFANRMRNKKAVTLNLRRPEGMKAFERMVGKSDIVLENFAMRDREKFGLNFQSLSRIKPSIILASVSAFGISGPNTHRIGFDPIAQAFSGAMIFNGFSGHPPLRTATAWVDYATAVHTAFGILVALRHRDKTGKGQVVDVALADVAAGLVALHGVYTEYEEMGVERPQTGNMSPYAFADSFKARYGWVFISLTRDGVWKRFLKISDMVEMNDDHRFSSDWKRAQNAYVLREVIAPWVAAREVEEVITLLGKGGVPCERINSIPQALSEEQFKKREILMGMAHPGLGTISTLGTIVKLSETPGVIRKGAPPVGDDNEEIFRDLLGYSDEEISKFKQEGVI